MTKRIDVPHGTAITPRWQARTTFQLPKAPTTTSPVPWLTSIHATSPRGPYGASTYRGNCGGYLIKDLLRFFQPRNVFDPMAGSGTCNDVCAELDIPCTSFDLRSGFDAMNPQHYASLETFDFVWVHPPYWRMIKYNSDDRCLSNAATLQDFITRFRTVMRNCRQVLSPRGHMAVLMGGYQDRGRQLPLPSLTTAAAIKEGFWPSCTEIVRMQYGNTSSDRSYNSSFIPGLHDTCTVFEHDS